MFHLIIISNWFCFQNVSSQLNENSFGELPRSELVWLDIVWSLVVLGRYAGIFLFALLKDLLVICFF